jgi:hypothetical protein
MSFSLFPSAGLAQVMVSRKLIIGSERFTGTSANMFSRSVMHLSRWTSPQVLRIISPFFASDTSIEGSDLLSFFSPSISLPACCRFGVVTATLRIAFEVDARGASEGQLLIVLTVPDLKMMLSKLPIPTKLPAGTYFTPSGCWAMRMYRLSI